MKVIFLDVDGVLNNNGAFKRSKELGCLTCTTDSLAVECLERLAFIWKAAGKPRVVLSSTWREIPIANRMIRCVLYAYGIPVFGETPQLDGYNRGQEILSWMDGRCELASYVILDDETFDFQECGLSGRHVHTSMHHGLTDKHAARAIELLLS